ncbi:MAG: MBL fold metallo-hydrolase [Anaerolineales bacterium]|nr:MBL fold metallo-hydrolase [Anaerolineales bacterium]
MLRERVSDNVYWFQSEIYAQVTAGVITGPHWAIVIDTLAMPEETLAMREFIEHDLDVPVRYVINTHYHADHTWGNCFFPGSTIIAHSRCRELLIEHGIPALETAKKHNSTLRQVKIVLPHITFRDSNLNIRIGKKNLTIFPAIGHSEDGIAILVEEDRVLFAGDVFMPLPYLVDGDIDQMIATTKQIGKMGLENIVQGHGDIILRGEIEAAVKENLGYLSALKKVVRTAQRRKTPIEYLESIHVADCGKSRVYLGGLAETLHQHNLQSLFKDLEEN